MVAVGCKRGPVRDDTARRTSWRRRTGEVFGCDDADDGDERRAVVLVAACVDGVRFVGADGDTERRGVDGVVVDARRMEESDVRLLRGAMMERRTGSEDIADDTADDTDRRLGADDTADDAADDTDRRFGAESDAWVAT